MLDLPPAAQRRRDRRRGWPAGRAELEPAAGGDAGPAAELPAPGATEQPLAGWVWYPPANDGETLTAVGDTGLVRLFGIPQPNSDSNLFPLPSPDLPAAAAGDPVPGLAVPAPDGAVWVLANGDLRRFRLSLNPMKGRETIPTGPPDSASETWFEPAATSAVAPSPPTRTNTTACPRRPSRSASARNAVA